MGTPFPRVFEFDYWAIAQMEKGNHEALLKLSSQQLDVVGRQDIATRPSIVKSQLLHRSA